MTSNQVVYKAPTWSVGFYSAVEYVALCYYIDIHKLPRHTYLKIVPLDVCPEE
jgi:hypothetical protein